MRCFLAVSVPEEVRRDLVEMLRHLGARVPDARVLRSETLHLTLHFFAELDEGQAFQAGRAAQEAARQVSPFEAVLGGIGAFPDVGRPRVIWMGLRQGAWEMAALHRAIAEGLRRAGLPVEGRPYTPHLTLARLPGPTREAMRWLERPPSRDFGPFPVRTVVLFESFLRPEGAEHRPRMSFPLGHGDRDPSQGL